MNMLYRLRLKHSFDRKRLEKEINVNKDRLFRLEHEVRLIDKIKAIEVQKLCEYFNMSIEEFFKEMNEDCLKSKSDGEV